ncbi:MAG: hypothetical protein SGARI_001139 [Bacillariaceae sp.]
MTGQDALLAAIREKDWKKTEFVAKTNPLMMGWSLFDFYEDSEGTKTETAFMPHHIVVQHPDAAVSLIHTFSKIFPDGFSKPDSHYKRMPLHLACMNGCSPDLILELIAIDIKGKEDATQRAMNTADALGRLPIHYACKHKHLKPAIEKFIELNPESLKCADVGGFLPAHVACRFGQPVALCKLMVFKAPETVSWKTQKGNTCSMLASKYIEDEERKRQVVAVLERFAYTDSLLRGKGLRK